MKNGLYLAQFAVPSTRGQGWEAAHGAAYIRDSKVYGGDSGHWWQGDVITSVDNTFSIDLAIKVHTTGGSSSVFGYFSEFELKVSGKLNGDAWQADGETNVAPGRPMQLNLRLLQAD
jgi:hypothetical protein